MADYLYRSGQVEKALAWAPGNSEYWMAAAGLRDDPREALRRAVELNPYEARGWVRLGLAEEMEGNLAEAERCLLEAARRSLKFEPRWALTNFYFRRGRTEEFRMWAGEAARMSYGDPAPLFDLCRQVGRCAMPELEYARFLAGRGEADEAAEILLGMEKPEWVSDGLLEAERAVELWKRTRGERLEPLEKAIRLSGMQAERYEVASQWVPVEKGREYLIEARHEARQLAGAIPAERTGLKWVVEEDGRRVAESEGLRVGGGTVAVRFRAGGKKARLALVHEREAGAVRVEAEVKIVRVRFR